MLDHRVLTFHQRYQQMELNLVHNPRLTPGSQTSDTGALQHKRFESQPSDRGTLRMR